MPSFLNEERIKGTCEFSNLKGQEEDMSATSLQPDRGLSFKRNLFFFPPKKSIGKVNNRLLSYFVAAVFPCIEQ